MVANKANRMVGIIWSTSTFDFLDEGMLKILFKSLVKPHLEYGNCIWSPFLQEDITLIERVQRRATKILTNLKELEYLERHLELPTLAYRRVRGDLIQM